MRSGEGDYFTPTPKYHNPIWMVGMVSPFIYFLFFLSEEDIIGSQYCLEQGAWSCPCPSFTRKKNLDKQSYCRNLPQSPSDHKLKLAAKYSFSFDYWLLDGHVCLCPATKYMSQLQSPPEFLHTWTAEVEVAVAPPGRKTFFWTFGAINLLERK